MKSKALTEREFQHLRKMLAEDPKLEESVESAAAQSALRGKQRSLLIPYISAPRLKEPAWNP